MTHHGVKQNTLSPFGQEIVCGNPTSTVPAPDNIYDFEGLLALAPL